MKSIFTTALLFFFCQILFAQVPQGMNYQAVARDPQGQPLVNQSNFRVRFSILQSTASGSSVYIEQHNNVTTNAFGLFNLTIGHGTPQLGTFSGINWANGDKFLRVEIDPATGNFSLQGTSQLLSVPYALYAANGGGSNQWKTSTLDTAIFYNGNVGIGTDSALYNVSGTSDSIYKTYGFKGLHIQSNQNATLVLEGKDRSRLHFASNTFFNTRNYVIESTNFTRDSSSALVIGTIGDNLFCRRGLITFHENGNLLIGDNCNNYRVPKSKLQIAQGDIYLEEPNRGIIMKSPNGSCWRTTVNNSGQLEAKLIPCPE